MSIQNQSLSVSVHSQHQQSSPNLNQEVQDVLSSLTIMETYTEIDPTQINQSSELLPKIDSPDDAQFLESSGYKPTPFQASLSFIQCKEEYRMDQENKHQAEQRFSDSSSSSGEEEEIIKKTVNRFSPPRETLSILKRKKPAYSRGYGQHYKSRQDDTICNTHYHSSPFNRNNKSTFIRSDSQTKRYCGDRRFNKTRVDEDSNFATHGNFHNGHQRMENRYESKQEQSHQHPQKGQNYYNNQPQGNSYVVNGENGYWGGYYQMQQMDWAQWNWYNRMKYYEYINTAHTAYPPQFHGFYPPAAVNFAVPAHIPSQHKVAEVQTNQTNQTKVSKEGVCPEKKGKVCEPKFQMTINQCKLVITCTKSPTSDILMIPYSINDLSLYPAINFQDYWLSRDKMDKIITESKMRNGDVSFIATDRSSIKTIAFVRVTSLKEECFNTSFNRGLTSLLTLATEHGKTILVPYSFSFGSSKEKINKIISFLQQQPSPNYDSITINCEDMKSFRRMADGAGRCLSSLDEQNLIFY